MEKKIFTKNSIVFAPSICYEILFSSEIRKRANRANVLINLSDLGWFENSWASPYLLKVAQVRAMEADKPMLYSVNQGFSAYILSKGEILKTNNKKGEYFMFVELTPKKGYSFYSKYGYLGLLALIGLWLSSIYFIQKERM